jgi:hypothetical protein
LKINIDFDQISQDIYQYVIRKNGKDFRFVQVIHPPAMVLGHELGHILQRHNNYGTILNEKGWNWFIEGQYFEKINCVIELALTKIKKLGVIIEGTDSDANEKLRIEALVKHIDQKIKNCKNNAQVKTSKGKRQLEDISIVLKCISEIWNGGYYDDLLNILPTKIGNEHSLNHG